MRNDEDEAAAIVSTRVDAAGRGRRILYPEGDESRIRRLRNEGWPSRFPLPAINVSRLAVFGARVLPRWDRDSQTLTLEVELEVPERETQARTIVRSSASISGELLYHAHQDGEIPDVLQRVVAEALAQALSHEVAETLRVDGAPWEDPHARVFRDVPGFDPKEEP